MPEFDGGIEFLDIIVAESCGKGIEQKFRIGLPSMSFRQCDVAVAPRTRPTSFVQISGSITRYRFRESLE